MLRFWRPHSKVSRRLVLLQVSRVLVADRSAGRALRVLAALQKETPIPHAAPRGLHIASCFLRYSATLGRESHQVPRYYPNMSCWKSLSLGLVGRRHRPMAARPQQRPPCAPRFPQKSADPQLCLHRLWAGTLVLASSTSLMLTSCHLQRSMFLNTAVRSCLATKAQRRLLLRLTKLNRFLSPKADQADANTGGESGGCSSSKWRTQARRHGHVSLPCALASTHEAARLSRW